MKCAACTKLGQPCVANSMEAINVAQENLQKDLDKDSEKRDRLFEELAELQARMSRKRKVLEQTKERAKRKRSCLISEMEADGEDMSQLAFDASLVSADFLASWPELDSFDPPSAGESPPIVPGTR